VLGKPIERTVIEPDEFIDRAVERAMSRPLALMLESGFRSRAVGDVAEVDPSLQKILGRPRRRLGEQLPRLISQIRPTHDIPAPLEG
jgi:hypothetical protein